MKLTQEPLESQHEHRERPGFINKITTRVYNTQNLDLHTTTLAKGPEYA